MNLGHGTHQAEPGMVPGKTEMVGSPSQSISVSKEKLVGYTSVSVVLVVDWSLRRTCGMTKFHSVLSQCLLMTRKSYSV